MDKQLILDELKKLTKYQKLTLDSLSFGYNFIKYEGKVLFFELSCQVDEYPNCCGYDIASGYSITVFNKEKPDYEMSGRVSRYLRESNPITKEFIEMIVDNSEKAGILFADSEEECTMHNTLKEHWSGSLVNTAENPNTGHTLSLFLIETGLEHHYDDDEDDDWFAEDEDEGRR